VEDDPDGDDFGRAPRRPLQDTPNAVLLSVGGALLGLGFGLTGRCTQGPLEVLPVVELILERPRHQVRRVERLPDQSIGERVEDPRLRLQGGDDAGS
jgi:hypothetical protein